MVKKKKNTGELTVPPGGAHEQDLRTLAPLRHEAWEEDAAFPRGVPLFVQGLRHCQPAITVV